MTSSFASLHFFYEREKFILDRVVLASSISTAILRVLAANGIGITSASGCNPPANMREAESMSVVNALRDVLSGKSSNAFAEAVTACDLAYFDALGFHLVLWLRHVHGHSFIPRTALSDSGLTANIIRHALYAAVQAGVDQKHFSTAADGFPSICVLDFGVAVALSSRRVVDSSIDPAEAIARACQDGHLASRLQCEVCVGLLEFAPTLVN